LQFQFYIKKIYPIFLKILNDNLVITEKL
jgi:hypothetical protein